MTEGKTILVADDEAHIVNVVALKLRSAGFEVITASNGAEALELARSHRPALLITDCQMPEMSGLELGAALAADEATRSIPLIMLTGRGFEIGDADTATTNIKQVLPKPFSPRQVLGMVHELVGETVAAC